MKSTKNKKTITLRAVIASTLAVLLAFLLPLQQVSAASYILPEGLFANESIEYVPTWYLRHLQGDTTRDGLLRSEIAAGDLTKVTNELTRRQSGTSDGEVYAGTLFVDQIDGDDSSLGINGKDETGTSSGGAIVVTAGDSGNGATGNGGDVTVAGGAATSTNGSGGTVTINGGVNTGTGLAGIVMIGGANPLPLALNVLRSTIANAGTISDAQHRGQVLYQDASGGAVTMTTRTGTQISAAFPDLAVGNAILQCVASNHATNTSTIAGGTDVTLVGSGAVVNTGGCFLLIKTAATTFDLVRIS